MSTPKASLGGKKRPNQDAVDQDEPALRYSSKKRRVEQVTREAVTATKSPSASVPKRTSDSSTRLRFGNEAANEIVSPVAARVKRAQVKGKAPLKRSQSQWSSQAAPAEQDVWEIPDSEDELSAPLSACVCKPISEDEDAGDEAPEADEIMILEDEGDDNGVEQTTPSKSSRRNRGPSWKVGKQGEVEDDTEDQRTPSRSSARKRTRQSTKVERDAAEGVHGNSKPNETLTKSQSSRQSARTRGAAPKTVPKTGEQAGCTEGGPSDQAPSVREKHAVGWQRVRDQVEVVDGALPLKDILTPRTNRRGKTRRKSVAFSSAEKQDGEVHFGHLPTKAKHKAPKQAVTNGASVRKVGAREEATGESAEEEVKASAECTEGEEDSGEGDGSEGEQEEIVCSICSRPESRPPNMILLCDGCDVPLHQNCAGVAIIPKGDWFCQGCCMSRRAEATEAECQPKIANFEQHLRGLQRVLIDRCTGRRRIKLIDQDEAHNKTLQLVEQTVLAGEGNSMLVIGARGSGKTTLVESVVSEMGQAHRTEFYVVRLNGFVHTDDKLALKEMWRQLGKEMQVEDELVDKTSNHADTLASLLALLSQPAEISGAQEGLTSRSIVVVIDHFDLFTAHARQTLLYNLFDIAQARKAPIAVLGLTTRVDVVERLEKRVKSRFSHRYVHLSLAKSLPAYWTVCRQGLCVDFDDAESEGLDVRLAGHAPFMQWWHDKVEALHKTSAFLNHLEHHFHSSKSVAAFLTTCLFPLSQVSPASLSLCVPAPATTPTPSLEPPDAKLDLLRSLSDLDLALLIAAARLDIVAHTDTVNFDMAYDEYTALVSRQRVQTTTSGMLALGAGARVWGRGVAGSAWERLVGLGLLVPSGVGGAGGKGGGGRVDGRMWRLAVVLEEIAGAVNLGGLLGKWCREI